MIEIVEARRHLAVVAALVVAACSAGDAREAASGDGDGASPEPAAGTGAAGVLAGRGPWTSTSSGGARVELSVAETPLREGPLRVRLAVDGASPEAAPRSVDLTSPTMPMHGIVRSPVRVDEDGHYADLEVPMDGRWAIYVNLDDGTDAATFVFDVLSADGSAGHEHHGGSADAAAGDGNDRERSGHGDGGSHQHGAL